MLAAKNRPQALCFCDERDTCQTAVGLDHGPAAPQSGDSHTVRVVCRERYGFARKAVMIDLHGGNELLGVAVGGQLAGFGGADPLKVGGRFRLHR